ncbi:MAG: hypothetical protein N4A31_01530 [Rickettsiales bacterium]|jgi:hypothetical protein|nr:hypothetical protein [Rickettsiales bacterium]
MLFPPTRYTSYLIKNSPYVIKFLSNVATKAITNFVSVVVSNNNGDNFFWKTNIPEGRDFHLNYELGSSIRTILTKYTTNTHYTGNDDFPTPWQIQDLREEDEFVEITVDGGEGTTNHYIVSTTCGESLDVPSMTAQVNGLVSRVISEVTSKIPTYVYSTEDKSSTTPILLGDGINTNTEEF